MIKIEYCDAPTPEEREAILGPLVDFNHRAAPASSTEPFAFFLKDDAGEIVGGLWGETFYEWLYVDLLYVPESLRGTGQGAELLARAEALAEEKDCVGVWLYTFGFQALDFYQRQGYTIFGDLPVPSRRSTRYFLKKTCR
ncbi:GNAT family N-acetyltransferase [Halomonas salifodinae]|uniref:GNAT family N-acetyltransferase n=1 Tax=Halomonas salifodinae TaxID=438745 RepID=UPI0033BA214D